MIRFLLTALSLFLLAGCSVMANEDLKGFATEKDAMKYGLNEKGLTGDAVVSLIEENNETFVFYKKDVEDGVALDVATIYLKDNQYVWYDGSPDVQLIDNATGKHIHVVSWSLESGSGNMYEVYSGISDETNKTIQTKQGPITPNVDKKTGILSYVEMAEK